MVQLNQITPIYVTYTIPEIKLSEVRKFSTARRLKVFAYVKGQRVNAAEGELTFIDNGVDMSCGRLYAFKITPTGHKQAAGSPYSVKPLAITVLSK